MRLYWFSYLCLVQVPQDQGVHLPVLGILDVDLEQVHELLVDAVGGEVLHGQFRVVVVGVGKQALEPLVLLLGGLVDAVQHGAGGDQVVQVAHDAPLRRVAVQVGQRPPRAAGLVPRRLLRHGHAVGDLDETVPHAAHVRVGEDEHGVILLEHAHDVERQVGRVDAGQHGAALDQLGLHQGQLLEQGDAPVQQTLDVEGLARQVEQVGDVVDDGEVDGGGGGVEGGDHLGDGVAALAGHAVLVKVGQQAGQLLELVHHLAED